MEVVIDICEETFEAICREKNSDWIPLWLVGIIKNGLQLPKGHGRMIDADSFKETLDYYIREAGWSKEHNESLGWCKEFIDAELTVIEADKESEE